MKRARLDPTSCDKDGIFPLLELPPNALEDIIRTAYTPLTPVSDNTAPASTSAPCLSSLLSVSPSAALAALSVTQEWHLIGPKAWRQVVWALNPFDERQEQRRQWRGAAAPQADRPPRFPATDAEAAAALGGPTPRRLILDGCRLSYSHVADGLLGALVKAWRPVEVELRLGWADGSNLPDRSVPLLLEALSPCLKALDARNLPSVQPLILYFLPQAFQTSDLPQLTHVSLDLRHGLPPLPSLLAVLNHPSLTLDFDVISPASAADRSDVFLPQSTAAGRNGKGPDTHAAFLAGFNRILTVSVAQLTPRGRLALLRQATKAAGLGRGMDMLDLMVPFLSGNHAAEVRREAFRFLGALCRGLKAPTSDPMAEEGTGALLYELCRRLRRSGATRALAAAISTPPAVPGDGEWSPQALAAIAEEAATQTEALDAVAAVLDAGCGRFVDEASDQALVPPLLVLLRRADLPLVQAGAAAAIMRLSGDVASDGAFTACYQLLTPYIPPEGQAADPLPIPSGPVEPGGPGDLRAVAACAHVLAVKASTTTRTLTRDIRDKLQHFSAEPFLELLAFPSVRNKILGIPQPNPANIFALQLEDFEPRIGIYSHIAGIVAGSTNTDPNDLVTQQLQVSAARQLTARGAWGLLASLPAARGGSNCWSQLMRGLCRIAVSGKPDAPVAQIEEFLQALLSGAFAASRGGGRARTTGRAAAAEPAAPANPFGLTPSQLKDISFVHSTSAVMHYTRFADASRMPIIRVLAATARACLEADSFEIFDFGNDALALERRVTTDSLRSLWALLDPRLGTANGNGRRAPPAPPAPPAADREAAAWTLSYLVGHPAGIEALASPKDAWRLPALLGALPKEGLCTARLLVRLSRSSVGRGGLLAIGDRTTIAAQLLERLEAIVCLWDLASDGDVLASHLESEGSGPVRLFGERAARRRLGENHQEAALLLFVLAGLLEHPLGLDCLVAAGALVQRRCALLRALLDPASGLYRFRETEGAFPGLASGALAFLLAAARQPEGRKRILGLPSHYAESFIQSAARLLLLPHGKGAAALVPAAVVRRRFAAFAATFLSRMSADASGQGLELVVRYVESEALDSLGPDPWGLGALGARQDADPAGPGPSTTTTARDSGGASPGPQDAALLYARIGAVQLALERTTVTELAAQRQAGSGAGNSGRNRSGRYPPSWRDELGTGPGFAHAGPAAGEAEAEAAWFPDS